MPTFVGDACRIQDGGGLSPRHAWRLVQEIAKEFLEGYGMTPREYTKCLPYMRALNTLNYGRAVEQLMLQDDRARLAWYRVRLQGLLDLYFPPNC